MFFKLSNEYCFNIVMKQNIIYIWRCSAMFSLKMSVTSTYSFYKEVLHFCIQSQLAARNLLKYMILRYKPWSQFIVLVSHKQIYQSHKSFGRTLLVYGVVLFWVKLQSSYSGNIWKFCCNSHLHSLNIPLVIHLQGLLAFLSPTFQYFIALCPPLACPVKLERRCSPSRAFFFSFM